MHTRCDSPVQLCSSDPSPFVCAHDRPPRLNDDDFYAYSDDEDLPRRECLSEVRLPPFPGWYEAAARFETDHQVWSATKPGIESIQSPLTYSHGRILYAERAALQTAAAKYVTFTTAVATLNAPHSDKSRPSETAEKSCNVDKRDLPPSRLGDFFDICMKSAQIPFGNTAVDDLSCGTSPDDGTQTMILAAGDTARNRRSNADNTGAQL